MPLQLAIRNRGLVRTAKLVIRVVVLSLVAWGIWRTVEKAVADFRAGQSQLDHQIEALDRQAAELRAGPGASAAELDALAVRRRQLQSQRFSVWRMDPWWLAAAGALYLIGSGPCWLFWRSSLRAMGQYPGAWESLRAYYIGHLGKYVPGKALVVVLRSGLIRSERVDATVAAASVFVETLTTMAVGALVAAAILAVRRRDDPQLLVLAIGLMICAGVPTLPPIFRRLVRLSQAQRANPQIDRAVQGLSYRLMLVGSAGIAIGWCLFGLSLWSVLRAMATPADGVVEADFMTFAMETLPLLTACAALAVVAGFLSLLPAGAGVREYVIMTLLAANYGAAAAVAAAILLRLVWMVSEVLLSVILYVSVRSENVSPCSRR